MTWTRLISISIADLHVLINNFIMAESTKKRTLDAFFTPPGKKARAPKNNGSEKEDKSIEVTHVRLHCHFYIHI
jgi:hypothetical protein